SAEVPISNSSIESFTSYENDDIYSKDSNNFDKFSYKKKELEKIEN
ncbi:32594_t:CDS:1, partial [Gigaspora margarita]